MYAMIICGKRHTKQHLPFHHNKTNSTKTNSNTRVLQVNQLIGNNTALDVLFQGYKSRQSLPLLLSIFPLFDRIFSLETTRALTWSWYLRSFWQRATGDAWTHTLRLPSSSLLNTYVKPSWAADHSFHLLSRVLFLFRTLFTFPQIDLFK